MKKIIYNDCIEFILPDFWIAETTDDGCICYEQGDDANTLTVEVFVATSPSLVNEHTCIDMLQTLIDGDGEITRLNQMTACKFLKETFVEDDMTFSVHNWYVATAELPQTGKIASFSFISPNIPDENSDVESIITMLDKSIRNCIFI